MNTIQNQKNAIKSHINFINYQKQKYNVECDVILNLYSLTQEKDDKIIEYYNNCNLKKVNFHKNLLGEPNLIKNSIQLFKDMDYINYDYFLMTRADIFIKDYFNNIFDINDNKIKFSFINEYKDHNNKSQCGTIINNVHTKISICHIFSGVPKKYFNLLFDSEFISKNHDAFMFLMDYYKEQYYEHISLFINTYHSSSTNLEWNPLFNQVGRTETKIWNKRNQNRILDIKTLESKIFDTENIYN